MVRSKWPGIRCRLTRIRGWFAPWREIFLNNPEAVLEILQRFNEDLTALQCGIRWGDKLQELFTRARDPPLDHRGETDLNCTGPRHA
jgi:hypothetical protein